MMQGLPNDSNIIPKTVLITASTILCNEIKNYYD